MIQYIVAVGVGALLGNMSRKNKMAHGGMHGQGYDDKLDESLGMRDGRESGKKQSRKDRRDESAGMEKAMGRRKYASVGTMDMGDRMMADGGNLPEFVSTLSTEQIVDDILSLLSAGEMTEFQADMLDNLTQEMKKRGFGFADGGMTSNIPEMAHGGMHKQGYDDKLDESLGMRTGLEAQMEQSKKDRRDESAGMERAMGRRKYASVGTMDMGDRMMGEGGKVSKFDKLARKVARDYRKKGFSAEKAMEIGEGTAANVYRAQQAKKS